MIKIVPMTSARVLEEAGAGGEERCFAQDFVGPAELASKLVPGSVERHDCQERLMYGGRRLINHDAGESGLWYFVGEKIATG